METPALVVLERAEHAARERRLAAGLEAERRVAAARAEATRIVAEAETEAEAAAARSRDAILGAADLQIAALETGIDEAIRPGEAALAAARALVVAELLGEIRPGAAVPAGPAAPAGDG